MIEKNEKKGCLVGLACLISGIICWFVGSEYEIYVLLVLGYMLFPCAGSLYAQYASKNKARRWSVMTQVFFIVACLVMAIVFTLIGYGKLW